MTITTNSRTTIITVADVVVTCKRNRFCSAKRSAYCYTLLRSVVCLSVSRLLSITFMHPT